MNIIMKTGLNLIFWADPYQQGCHANGCYVNDYHGNGCQAYGNQDFTLPNGMYGP